MVTDERLPTKACRFLVRYADSFKLAERVVVLAHCYDRALSHLLAETATSAVLSYKPADKNFKPIKN